MHFKTFNKNINSVFLLAKIVFFLESLQKKVIKLLRESDRERQREEKERKQREKTEQTKNLCQGKTNNQKKECMYMYMSVFSIIILFVTMNQNTNPQVQENTCMRNGSTQIFHYGEILFLIGPPKILSLSLYNKSLIC